MAINSRLFRFHLLSLVLASFAASGVLYLNTIHEIGTIRDPYWQPVKGICNLPMDFETRNYGWPVKFVQVPIERPFVVDRIALAEDISVLVVVIAAALFLAELVFFRRRN